VSERFDAAINIDGKRGIEGRSRPSFTRREKSVDFTHSLALKWQAGRVISRKADIFPPAGVNEEEEASNGEKRVISFHAKHFCRVLEQLEDLEKERIEVMRHAFLRCVAKEREVRGENRALIALNFGPSLTRTIAPIFPSLSSLLRSTQSSAVAMTPWSPR